MCGFTEWSKDKGIQVTRNFTAEHQHCVQLYRRVRNVNASGYRPGWPYRESYFLSREIIFLHLSKSASLIFLYMPLQSQLYHMPPPTSSVLKLALKTSYFKEMAMFGIKWVKTTVTKTFESPLPFCGNLQVWQNNYCQPTSSIPKPALKTSYC